MVVTTHRVMLAGNRIFQPASCGRKCSIFIFKNAAMHPNGCAARSLPVIE
jgi:hypothetical protein